MDAAAAGGDFRSYTKSELAEKLGTIGLPYAPIARPRDLFDDPHLNARWHDQDEGSRGYEFRVPGLPLELDGERRAVWIACGWRALARVAQKPGTRWR